jgi:REP element-mobilizing transposase RayT
VYDRKCLFGEVVEGKMVLNKMGKIADKCLTDIPSHFENTEIPLHIVMPNHVHAIVNIYEEDFEIRVGGRYICHLPKRRQNQKLPVIIGTYKAAVTREINKLCPSSRFKWQRYYHDHIIGTEKALENIYYYIMCNPDNWNKDLENEEYLKMLNVAERKTKSKLFYKELAGR